MRIISTLLISCAILLGCSIANAQAFFNYTTAEGLPHNNVLCLDEDTLGNMWFGTQDGIAKYDGGAGWIIYNTTTHPALAHNTINALCVDSKNNIWVGTDNGVSMFDGSTFTTYTTVQGLGNNRINYIAEAPNGDMWFGEFSGATVYNGTTFTAYGTAAGLPFGGVNYVAFDSKGEVYLASGLGGFIKFDGSNFTVYNETNDGLLSDVVRAIAIDSADNKWVGTAKGISVFDSTNTLVTQHTIMLVLPAPDTLNPVEDVKINSMGEVWAGIYVDYLVTEGGIASNNGGASWTDYDVSDGLVGPVVRKMTIDQFDNVWVATSSGVSKLSFLTGTTLNENSLKNFNVYPNPSNGLVTISKSLPEPALIEIINIYGERVRQDHFSVESMNLDLSSLCKGVYFLKLTNEAGSSVEKIIIE